MVSSRPRPRATNGVLLVEGRSDEQVVLHLCNRHSSFSVEGEFGSEYVELNTSSRPSFSVIVKNNDSELLKSLRLELSPAAGREVVGIIIDADDDIVKRWDDLRARLAGVSIQLPDKPKPNGTVIKAEGLPHVGIWIMPDNSATGELEDFAQQMLQADDPVWPLSQIYINGIPEEHRKFQPHKLTKAQFHAWLATRARPGLIGRAIRATDLEIDGPLCRKFIAWLEELFS